MADDERRAELEAVAAAIREHFPRGGLSYDGWLRRSRRMAEAALDRVRDARGEIDAVMRALIESEYAPHYGSEHCVCGPQATPANDCPVHWAVAVVERLQDASRLRDARGDDEPPPIEEDAAYWRKMYEELHSLTAGDPTTIYHAHEQLCRRVAELEAARSPQGEDHEAGKPWKVKRCPTCAELESNTFVQGCSHSEPTTLIEVSPVRDGTVAVEDVRARAIAEVVTWLRGAGDTRFWNESFKAAAHVIEREFSPASTGDRE